MLRNDSMFSGLTRAEFFEKEILIIVMIARF